MQPHYTALLIRVIGYAQHVRTTDSEMESTGWQLACRKGRDMALKPKDYKLTSSHHTLTFINTRVTVWLKAPSFSVPKEQDSFFEICLSSCDPVSGTDIDSRPKQTWGSSKCSDIFVPPTLTFNNCILHTVFICGFRIILKINSDCFPWIRNWRWRQYVPPKRWFISTNPHGAQKTNIDIFTAVRTSNLACFCFASVLWFCYEVNWGVSWMGVLVVLSKARLPNTSWSWFRS
jgi:hypothetical protein